MPISTHAALSSWFLPATTTCPSPPPRPRTHHQPRRRANGFVCCRRSGYATPNFTTKFPLSHSQPGGAVVSNVKWIGRLNSNPLKPSTNPFKPLSNPFCFSGLSPNPKPLLFQGLERGFPPWFHVRHHHRSLLLQARRQHFHSRCIMLRIACTSSQHAHHRNTSSPSSTSQDTCAAQTFAPQAGPARLQ